MSYTKFLRWVLENLNLAPKLVEHAGEVWDAIESGDESRAAREAGEFLIWLSSILEDMPEFADDGSPRMSRLNFSDPEDNTIQSLAADERGAATGIVEMAVAAREVDKAIGLGGVMMAWQLIQLIWPILRLLKTR